MNTGTLDTAGVPASGVASLPPNPPLDWDDDTDLIWIRAEIEKSTAITAQAVAVDWAGIVERATRFLSLSTDWVLLAATGRAAVQAAGLAELPHVLERLTTTAKESWTTMQPALPRGLNRRASYVGWFVDGLTEAIARNTLTGTTAEHLKASLERLSAFDETLRAQMGQAYPGVRPLREALKNALDKLPAAAATPAATNATPAPAVAGQGASSAPAVAEFPPPIDDIDAADRVLSKVRSALFAVADARQKADAADPLAFKLRRLGAWLRQTTEVVLDESGRMSGVTGPQADEHEHLRAALESDRAGVVSAAEALLERYPLWLDANYLTFLALSRSGAPFRAAAETVRSETVALLQRLPQLPDLEFSDEVPLASPDTRDWLHSQTTAGSGGEPAVATHASKSNAGDDVLDAAERAANELAAQGQLDKSFEVLNDGIRDASSGRARFQWRLAAGRHAARHGRVDLAVHLFTGLDREAKKLRLDVWEPELWAAVLTSMLELGRKGRRDRLAPEVLALLPEVEQRLSRLDLMAAVRLSKERG